MYVSLYAVDVGVPGQPDCDAGRSIEPYRAWWETKKRVRARIGLVPNIEVTLFSTWPLTSSFGLTRT